MKELNSFIRATIELIAARPRKAKGKNTEIMIAEIILEQTDAHICDCIQRATYQLYRERVEAKSAGTAVRANPEAMFWFLQRLMNQICWSAQSLHTAQSINDAEERIGSTSYDYSQDRADEIGVEPMSNELIGDAVEADFRALLIVTGELLRTFNYVDDADLFMYSNEEPTGEIDENGQLVWEVTGTADSFAEAVTLMEKARELRDSRKMEDAMGRIGSVDYSSGEVSTPSPVPVQQVAVKEERPKVRSQSWLQKFLRKPTAGHAK